MNRYIEALYETCYFRYLVSVLLELLLVRAMMRADYLTDQELSSKETIRVLQVILAIYYEQDLIHQGMVAQEGILVLL